MTKAPCKDCAERHIACHDTCEKFIQWHTEWMELRKNRVEYLSKFLQTDKKLQKGSKAMRKFYKRNTEAEY